MGGVKITFDGYEGEIVCGRYNNNRIALDLVEVETGQVITHITRNLPDVPMGPDEVAIKTYSENEGILEVLLPTGLLKEAVTGLLKEAVKGAISGHVTFPIYKLDMNIIAKCRKY